MKRLDRPRIERRRSRIGPVSIAYEMAGDGPPVVLIHGLSWSSRWWSRNIEVLAQQFRVYVVDLVGFGNSRGLYPFALNEASVYLAQWMDLIGVKQAAVVGHSMGGFIAADLAADIPDRVTELVLVDAAVLPFDANYLRKLFDLTQTVCCVPFNFLPVLLLDAYRAGPLTISKAAYELLTTDIRPKLAKIHAPTLVVWGEHDTLVPLALGKQLCRHIKDVCELMIIKGAGHNPMWDRPEAFNRTVINFLLSARGQLPYNASDTHNVAAQNSL